MLNSRVEQMVAEAAMALILDDLYEARDMAEIAMAASGFRYWHAGVVRIGVEWAAGTMVRCSHCHGWSRKGSFCGSCGAVLSEVK